jgi:hypothetical protein
MRPSDDDPAWTIESMHAHLLKIMDERDRRYEQRFEAQETAIRAALAAAEKALDEKSSVLSNEFHEHLAQYRHEVGLAFESSDRAISKAEIATEKRFDSVNEFRAQLTDQASRFMPRTESEATTNRIIERITDLDNRVNQLISRAEAVAAADRNTERIQELTDRLNRQEGRGIGLNAGWLYLLGLVAAVGTLISLYLAFRGG